jgi:hypothetical protein
MLTNHRLVALVVVPLLIAAALIEHDGLAIVISATALTLALVALGATLWARRGSR